MSSKRGIATGAAATEAESTGRHFLVILGLGAAVWVLLLRFFFPGYLDPFVPFHMDHFRYLGASAEGYGVMRYIRLYPRPIGNLIFDLLGRLGTRGMLVPVFALTLLNAALLIRYVERLTGRLISAFTVAFFFTLVFANPENYSSVKEDILAVVCLFCVVAIFHLWQNYVESGHGWHIAGIIALAFLSSYVKETYFATLVVFFLLQALICARRRKMAVALVIANVLIAVLSLHLNAQRGSFVQMHAAATDPYFQNWSALSILRSYYQLLKFLIFPVPALLVVGALVVFGWKDWKALFIGLTALIFVATTLLPHSLLPNHLEDQYAWLGAFFLFTPLLLADAFIPKQGLPLLVAILAAIAVCAETMREYRLAIPNGMAGWLREQEQYQRTFLSSWPIMKNISKPGGHELVGGPTIPFQPFSVPGYIRKSLGEDRRWTVVLPATLQKRRELTTEVIDAANVTSLDYDHIFLFSPNGKLTGIYSRKDAQAMFKAGSFGQFPGLVSTPRQ